MAKLNTTTLVKSLTTRLASIVMRLDTMLLIVPIRTTLRQYPPSLTLLIDQDLLCLESIVDSLARTKTPTTTIVR
jgi:hypothetical protein